MSKERRLGPVLTRRETAKILAAGAIASGGMSFATSANAREGSVPITCFIRYQIDPSQREAFAQYAATWGKIIPRCGGDLIGYFLPHEGTNDIGYGLIAFESLAAYEKYRNLLRGDPAARDNFMFAQSRKFILREERTFLENVPGTMGLASKP